jgi:hypothetical protein
LADDQAKARAKTQAMRAWQAEDGRKAMAEYEANIAATREKTEKLRALRLAREAAEAKAAPPATKATTKTKGRAKATKKSARAAGSLSDWLDDQRDSGRNT